MPTITRWTHVQEMDGIGNPLSSLIRTGRPCSSLRTYGISSLDCIGFWAHISLSARSLSREKEGGANNTHT